MTQRYFSILTLALVCANLFTFAYHYTGSDSFNAVGNAISVVIILYSGFVLLVARAKHSKAGIVFLTLAALFVSFSWVYNFENASMIDVLKYMSLYVFFPAGYACASPQSSTEARFIYVLAALPLLFFAVTESAVFPDNSITFAYFPNSNTAALYFSALLFALTPHLRNLTILIQFINVGLMNKVGAALATVFAIGLWVAFPLRRESIVAIILVAIGGVVAFALGAFDRVLAVSGDVFNKLIELGPSAIAKMSFRELVEMTGSTDLSGYFRVIHWANILSIYSSGDVLTWLLGYGAGQTPFLANIPLIPHNDYLRILAEYGVFNALIFISFIIFILKSLQTRLERIFFTILIIYFFSENLLDNFTSMAIFFAYAGRFAATTEPKPGVSRSYDYAGYDAPSKSVTRERAVATRPR